MEVGIKGEREGGRGQRVGLGEGRRKRGGEGLGRERVGRDGDSGEEGIGNDKRWEEEREE